MLIQGDTFNGYKMPQILKNTTNFNSSNYTELDIVNSMFRDKILHLNVGPDSDNMAFFCIQIEGMGECSQELGYYDDSRIIWGTWTRLATPNQSPGLFELKENFIGFVSDLKEGASFYLQLHPIKVLKEEVA